LQRLIVVANTISNSKTLKSGRCALHRSAFLLYLTDDQSGSIDSIAGRQNEPVVPFFTSNQRIRMLRTMKLTVLLLIMLLPATLHAAFEVETILKADIGAPILDVTTNPAEELVFVLTPGAVVIYSTTDQVILDRIPVEKQFDRIAYQDPDRLVLTAAEPSRINIIGFSRIYDINLSGRAFKGPRDAKVTLVVFDDYQ
jgi:hypothetical protein